MESNDDDLLKKLRDITKNKECWAESIGEVAAILDEDYSVSVKAKALWLLGEMGLRYPAEIECYVDNIASFLDDNDSKLRERSSNAIGRIGRADKNLIIHHIDRLMEMRFASKVWTFSTLSISLIWASLGPMCLSVNDSDIINVF